MKKDRKGRIIKPGDNVAFDVPVDFEAAEKVNNEAWDIFWGRAEDKGIRVVIDPVPQHKDVSYDYSEDPTDMLIIRYAGDPGAEEMMRNAEGNQEVHTAIG